MALGGISGNVGRVRVTLYMPRSIKMLIVEIGGRSLGTWSGRGRESMLEGIDTLKGEG